MFMSLPSATAQKLGQYQERLSRWLCKLLLMVHYLPVIPDVLPNSHGQHYNIFQLHSTPLPLV
jgi:hypothetical protein